jgi:hypothetical protein
MDKEKFFEYKTMMMNGARHHFIRIKGESNWKLHRYDGPAIEPIKMDCHLKNGYYLNGIEYSKKKYLEIMKEREGLPYYKQSGFQTERQ